MVDEISEPFLVLHKVRGEPAFDIATKLMIGDEEGWIIPTSGHRAYPYWQISFQDMNEMECARDGGMFDRLPPMPPNWPDHYATKSSPPPSLSSFITAIIDKVIPKIDRRI